MELALEGVPIQVASVNMPSGLETQSKLVDNCAYPLFQDEEEVDVWGLMKGGKDDFFIYDPEGLLVRYYKWGTEPAINLSTDEGYAALKDAILQVAGGLPRQDRATEETEPGPEPE